jgi:hypothetical protein
MPSPKDYFRYAQECARSASERKYQDYREVLIEMAAVLTQLRWHESEIDEEPLVRARPSKIPAGEASRPNVQRESTGPTPTNRARFRRALAPYHPRHRKNFGRPLLQHLI